uniref:Odorant-binding protein n=1 Tax=Galeruca daurica TaxID=1651263 RepID=A0A1U9W4Y5_9CUCU|nr:odorant-binding protein [Galeruca daurica]
MYTLWMISVITMFAITVSASEFDDMRDRIMETKEYKECSQESGATYDDFMAFKNTTEVMCLFKCSLEKKGSLDKDGNIDLDNIKERLSGNTHLDDTKKEMFLKCAESVGKIDKCDDLLEFRWCLVNITKKQ